jgi:uncharacterized membrane protein
MSALRLGAAALLALLILQIVWHAWWLPPAPHQFWPTLALAVLPLLPGLWTCPRDLRRGVLIGGIVCLFYFCHGIGAVYADAAARIPGALEVALTLLVIGASGWDARHYKRAAK